MIFALILCAAGQLPAGCPTLPAGHSGSVAGPWCCRSRSAPRSRPRGAADVLRCRPVADVLPVVLPAGQLPAGCPTLPAGHSGSVAGPVVLPVKIGPTLPAPWCCRRAALPAGCRRAARGAAGPCCRRAALPVNSRPVAPRSRPVTREALPAPWCCRRAALPVNSRPVAHAPGPSLGKRCRPVVLPVKIGPTLPARGAADVLRSRPVADVPAFRPRGAAGQLPAGCRAAGYLTVGGSGLRPNRGKSWPERHAMACSCARFAGRSEATGGR